MEPQEAQPSKSIASSTALRHLLSRLHLPADSYNTSPNACVRRQKTRFCLLTVMLLVPFVVALALIGRFGATSESSSKTFTRHSAILPFLTELTVFTSLINIDTGLTISKV